MPLADVPVRLTTDDVHALARTQHVLLTPLAYASVDEWRRAANDAMRALVGADVVAFLLPTTDGPLIYSDEVCQQTLARFPELQPPPARDGTTVIERIVAERVGTIDTVYRTRDHRYFESAYYHEYMAPIGARQLLMLNHAFAGPGMLALRMANIQLARADLRRPFRARAFALARMVYPAFVAGVETYRRLDVARAALLRGLDHLGHALGVFDRDGRLVHETPPLTQLLDIEPDAALVRRAMAHTARGVSVSSVVAAAPVHEVPGRATRYQLLTTRFAPDGDSAPSAMVLVAVSQGASAPLTDADLQRRFRLTPSEVRVARFLAQGLRNTEIAAQLGVTEHTARRHTEHVLARLAVRSRAAVASALRGDRG